MHHNSRYKRKDPAKGYILFGIIFISVVGCLLHFLYDFSNKSTLIGMISPINESVWEHLKLAYMPTLLWWLISYYIVTRKKNIPFGPWFTSAVVSSFISSLFIIIAYYTYTGAFAIHSVILDISTLFVGIIIGQLKALRIYQRTNLRYYHYIMATIVCLLLLIAFFVFTFSPPHLPLFMDSSTGQYGR